MSSIVIGLKNQVHFIGLGEKIMPARITNPALLVPGAIQALQALSATVEKTGLPARTVGLVQLRASLINGCSVCVDMHQRISKQQGETDERLFAVGAWQHAPYFTDAERAALALTEALTRLSDRSDPVPDSLWNEVARHYNERQLAGLVLAITTINAWNRINVGTAQIAGEWIKSKEGQAFQEQHVAR
jgi:AhpD family alkylhydroperoxidase